MLGVLYTDDVTIRYDKVDDGFSDPVSATKTIKGAIQNKTKQRVDGKGVLIITDNLLLTNELLNDSDLIVYEGRDREISFKDTLTSHLFGTIDHYEYRF